MLPPPISLLTLKAIKLRLSSILTAWGSTLNLIVNNLICSEFSSSPKTGLIKFQIIATAATARRTIKTVATIPLRPLLYI